MAVNSELAFLESTLHNSLLSRDPHGVVYRGSTIKPRMDGFGNPPPPPHPEPLHLPGLRRTNAMARSRTTKDGAPAPTERLRLVRRTT